MQRIMICLIAFMLSLSGTELHEAFRLPLLWEHYSEHQVEKDSLSFLEFLEMHYSTAQAGQEHSQEDQNLPFKSHECNLILKSSDKLPAMVDLQILPELLYQGIVPPFFSDLPSGYSGKVWQPPQAC